MSHSPATPVTNGDLHPLCDWDTCSAILVKVEKELARVRFLLERSAPNCEPDVKIAADKAVQLCSIYFHAPIRHIRSRLRTDRVALARHVAIHLTRSVTHGSTTEIGDAFGLNHTTVIHALANVSNRCLEKETKAAVELLEGRMRAIFNRK